MNSHGDFDLTKIADRDLFPLLPDQASVLGATALTTGVGFGQSHVQTSLAGLRYGGPQLHRAVHLGAVIEKVGRSFSVGDPRIVVGGGYRKVNGLLGGYAHYGFGVRINVIAMEGDPAIAILHPFDPTREQKPFWLSEELRFGVAGCRAPFVHITFEQRSLDDLTATSLKLPAKAMIGLHLWRIALGVEGGLLYDVGTRNTRFRVGAVVEVFSVGRFRVSMTMGKFQISDGDWSEWNGRVLVQGEL